MVLAFEVSPVERHGTYHLLQQSRKEAYMGKTSEEGFCRISDLRSLSY
jgi:hypothetical protein